MPRLELSHSKRDDLPKLEKGRWDDYRYFVSIAKTTSIKRAATELGTTQSAVSKRLDRLERALGVKLVDRGPTGARLTYQGERVLTHALAAEGALTRAQEDAINAKSRIEGDCSVLLGDGIANCWLPPFLPPFFDLYPDIELKMMLDHDLSAPRNEIFDVRLHYHEPADSPQVARPLCTLHYIPFASRSYLARFGTPTSMSDLVDHRLIDLAQYLVSKGSWSSWFEENRIKRTSLFTNNGTLLARAVSAGAGIALMPTYIVLNNPELIPLNLGLHFSLRFFASYNRDRAVKQPVRIVLNFLRNSVFDPKSMPWFAAEFQTPNSNWPTLFAQAIDRIGQQATTTNIAAE
jgi:DNA-binding transcriptional LysR family regulator